MRTQARRAREYCLPPCGFSSQGGIETEQKQVPALRQQLPTLQMFEWCRRMILGLIPKAVPRITRHLNRALDKDASEAPQVCPAPERDRSHRQKKKPGPK